jgi:hypothetical protein
MKQLKYIAVGFILATVLIFSFPVKATVATFKADLITAVTNNFAAGDRTRIANSFASAYGYQATINGSPNPQTKADFAADRVVDFIKNVVAGEENKANLAAVATPTPLP